MEYRRYRWRQSRTVADVAGRRRVGQTTAVDRAPSQSADLGVEIRVSNRQVCAEKQPIGAAEAGVAVDGQRMLAQAREPMLVTD